ncbi:bifunctional diguanylate cyclase/phosphodiesterase [Actinoplanes sp. M2I2]|uniref:putative bifunctional diguanylate cyclase/phosphodiesterase n=1 Tax=Actinoplanes sp. M2I2 TaxID=1734444 RepID=UPI0020225F07|nr:EAL domain-containing protein [Actinoplanes sp. M2I2]
MIRNWRLFASLGLLATVVYTADVSPALNAACMLVVAGGSVWACFAGPRRHGAEPRTAWRLLGGAVLGGLAGVLLRPAVEGLPGLWPLLADGGSISSYAMLCAFLGLMLRRRQSIDPHAVLDGLIVCVAGALVVGVLLAAPAAAISDRPGPVSFVAGLYPLFDVVVLLLLVNLTFTATTWPVSLVTLMGAMTSMFVGDTAYAIVGANGITYASPLFDAPFLLGFVLVGVTALHPSVTRFGLAARPPVQAWSARRIAVLAPALASPFVLMAVRDSRGERITIAVAGVVIVALLLVRAITAVRSQTAAHLRAEHQAMHDALTGLPNRYRIGRELTDLLARLEPDGRRRVWVLLLDLDGFKLVNDGWGHDTGDQLIVEVARRLRAAAPPGVPVAALGGDEFLLATAGDDREAAALADDVRDCFAQTFPVRGTELTITCSIGISSAGAPFATDCSSSASDPVFTTGESTRPGTAPPPSGDASAGFFGADSAADAGSSSSAGSSSRAGNFFGADGFSSAGSSSGADLAAVAEALMRDADTAMYRAKAEGPGSRVAFDAAMHAQVRERIELEVALRKALGDGQLSVVYQPIVDLLSGRPTGAEALVRWTHPSRGPISPATFIPIAEDAGLIGAIGDWVRQESLRQVGEWRTDGTVGDAFYVSVNVSGRQLLDPGLPGQLASEMRAYGVPPACVAVEMTESVLVDSTGVAGRVVFGIRELGCQVLIDDFGTGFSALGYLRRFPVTGIKIDRSFVTGLGAGHEDDEIVRAIVSLSQALRLSVIAEGVETRVQRDALAAVGVTRGQGWLWGPAVPPAEFARHWHARRAAALAGQTTAT